MRRSSALNDSVFLEQRIDDGTIQKRSLPCDSFPSRYLFQRAVGVAFEDFLLAGILPRIDVHAGFYTRSLDKVVP